MAHATAAFCRLMARYAQWQNSGLADIAGTLTDEERALDRGAFFNSIAGTFNHLLWGDRLWLSRFANTPEPAMHSISESVYETPDWESYIAARAAQDAACVGWAETLSDDDLNGELRWHSGAAGREVSRPLALLIVHFFNHGTHHRGQVHAMLTAAGARPGDTDLFLMKEP